MLGLKLNHVSKWGPRSFSVNSLHLANTTRWILSLNILIHTQVSVCTNTTVYPLLDRRYYMIKSPNIVHPRRPKYLIDTTFYVYVCLCVDEYPMTVGPLQQHGLTLILENISNHAPKNVWDEITYPIPNFNGCTVQVLEWLSNFIPAF